MIGQPIPTKDDKKWTLALTKTLDKTDFTLVNGKYRNRFIDSQLSTVMSNDIIIEIRGTMSYYPNLAIIYPPTYIPYKSIGIAFSTQERQMSELLGTNNEILSLTMAIDYHQEVTGRQPYMDLYISQDNYENGPSAYTINIYTKS